jgi:hypothetical protein
MIMPNGWKAGAVDQGRMRGPLADTGNRTQASRLLNSH